MIPSAMRCYGLLRRPREEEVDSVSFLSWSKAFVTSINDLTEKDRKVLLTYEAYRSHMTLEVLENFHAYGVVFYALPEHTSGKTQPCDVVLFCF